jgi:predicted metalloprotease with PDZ domain
LRLRAALFLILATPAALAAQRSVDYQISFANHHQHEARVIVTFRGVPKGSALVARMSRSSPGRYAPSNFAKNVYDVTASDGRGRALRIGHPDSHAWSVMGHDGTVKIGYTVWGDRTDGTYLSIDHSHAHLNMPATFMFADGMENAPITLTIHQPERWKIATQLAPTAQSNVFTAPNMQWFLDSPTEVGPITMRTWTRSHGGKTSTYRISLHHLGTEGAVDSLTDMVKKIVDEEIALWGAPAPYDYGTYTFLIDYLPWANGDGMEHRNSTVITSRNGIDDDARRRAKLGTISHEFFHSWNMERLRSRGIEPFNFTNEDMSDDLWFGEGFTNYFDPLIIRRAGLTTNEQWIAEFGPEIVGTIESPARLHGSPIDMSRGAVFFDGSAFPDPVNRQNVFLSYYTWGSVVAAGLDLTLRTRFNKTLDDYMRLMWNDFGKYQSKSLAPTRPYTTKDLEAELAKFTGSAAFAREFFTRYIEGREVPDFARLLEPGGFRLVTDSVEKPYLGASLEDDSSGVFVNWSQQGGSAYGAGIANGDIIVSINGERTMTVDALNAALARRKPGEVVQVGIIQHRVRKTIPMTIRGRRAMKIVTYESIGVPVTPEIARFRESWLGSKVVRQ